MLGHSLHGSILYTLQVVVITLYSLDILCWTGRNYRGFEMNSPDTLLQSFTDPPLLFPYELMNYAEPIHMATPDHEPIIAAVI